MNAVIDTQPGILQRMARTYNPAKRAGERQRVEMLGKLDDRRQAALVAGDRDELTRIASEYVAIGCARLANQIVMEAEGL